MLSLEGYRATIGVFNMKFIGHWKYKYKKLFNDRIVNISHRHKINMHHFSLRLLLLTLLVHIAYFNLHYGFLKFSKLTLEGVESNPGSWAFTIDRVVKSVI